MYLFHHSAKRQQTNDIGHYHQTVEAVRHVPYQIYLRQGSQEYTDTYQRGINRNRLGAKQILDIGLSEEIPANDSGKCKEEHADRNKDLSEFTIYQRICELA